MVGDIASVCGLCICASLMCKITEKHSKEQTVLLVIAVTAMIFFNAADGLPAVLEKMDTLMEYSGLEKDYVSILFKALGVCWLTQFASDICRDCNVPLLLRQRKFSGSFSLLYWLYRFLKV